MVGDILILIKETHLRESHRVLCPCGKSIQGVLSRYTVTSYRVSASHKRRTNEESAQVDDGACANLRKESHQEVICGIRNILRRLYTVEQGLQKYRQGKEMEMATSAQIFWSESAGKSKRLCDIVCAALRFWGSVLSGETGMVLPTS